MNKSLLILSLVFLVVVLNGLTLPFCSKEEEEPIIEEIEIAPTITLNDEPLVMADSMNYDATITANFEQAEISALAWQKDAQLMLVSVKLPSDLSLNNSTNTFTYGSENVFDYWWTYSLAESSGKTVRALVNKDDYLGNNVKPINKTYWRTNYIEAFQIADNYGGKEFRQNNPNTAISLTLSVSEPKGWLWWLVEYKTPLGENFSVRINPNDQTIVNESGEVVTTGSVYTPGYTTEDFSSSTTDTTPTPLSAPRPYGP